MNTKKRTITGTLAMIIVLAVSAGCLFGCGNDDESDRKKRKSGYERTLQTFMNAYKNGDAKKIVELIPEKIVKAMGGKSGFEDYLEDTLDSQFEKLEAYDGNIKKMTYEIADVDTLDKDGIKDLEQEVKSNWGKKLGIKQAVEVEVEITIPIDGERETEEFEVTLVKIGDKWYALRHNIDLSEFCR